MQVASGCVYAKTVKDNIKAATARNKRVKIDLFILQGLGPQHTKKLMMKQSTVTKKWLGYSIRDLESAKRKFENLKDFDLVKALLVDEYEKR